MEKEDQLAAQAVEKLKKLAKNLEQVKSEVKSEVKDSK